MTEPSQKDLDRFAKWCLERYTERTTTKLVCDARTVCRYDGVPPHAKLKVKRLRDYALAWNIWQDCFGKPLPVPCPVVPDQSKLRGGRRARDPKRLREAVAFPRAEYDRMVELLDDDDAQLPAVVLLVLARTGLRIGDVLRLPLGEFRAGMKREDGIVTIVVKGLKTSVYSVRGVGAEERAWKALGALTKRYPGTWTVAAAMMDDVDASPEAGNGAYERCRKMLVRIGKSAKVSGRIHMHRFRRSVGVYLSTAGASMDEIQKTLIHSSSATTQSYVDESRATESAKLRGRLLDGGRR